MRSWANAYGGLLVLAGIAYFIALILGVVDGNRAFDASLDSYVAYKHFPLVAGIAGAILVLAGALASYDGIKARRTPLAVFGTMVIAAGIALATVGQILDVSIFSVALLSLNVIFVAVGIAAILKDAANGCIVGALVITVVTLVMDVTYMLQYIEVSSVYSAYLSAVLLIVIGAFCYNSEVTYEKVVAAESARDSAKAAAIAEAKAKEAEELAAARAAIAAKYEEDRIAAKAAREEAKKKAAEEAAAKKAAEEAAAKKAAEEAATKKAAEEAAAKEEAEKKAAEEAAAKAAAEEAEKKAAEEAAVAVAAEEAEKKAAEEAAAEKAAEEAAAKEEAEKKTAEAIEEAATARAAAEEAEKKAAEESAARQAAEADAANARAAAEEAEKKAAEADAARQAAEADAATAKAAAAAAAATAAAATVAAVATPAEPEVAPVDKVANACYARDMVFGRSYGEEKIDIAFPAEKIAVFVGEPADRTVAGWTAVCFDAAEVTDGEKEAEVIADYLAEAATVAAEATAVIATAAAVATPAEPEVAPVDKVANACYARDMVFGRSYGEEKIDIAFPAEKIAVFVGEPADRTVAGWTAVCFDAAEVTDGEKEAEVIADYLAEAAAAPAAEAVAVVAAEEVAEEAAEDVVESAAAPAESEAPAESATASESDAKKVAEAATVAAAAAVVAAAVSDDDMVASASDKICNACYSRGLAMARGYGDAKVDIAFPADKLAVFVFAGKPDESKEKALVKDGWTVIYFDAAEVTDGEKEAEVIIDYLAELTPEEAEEESVAVAAPVPETVYVESDFTNEDLGIEPVTVETPVRRASYNNGLRFRRKYGPYKIPVAFVSSKVAVYVFEGKPDHTNDAALEADGWIVLHFDGAEVTDGEKEAEVIEDYIKEVVRAKKAAAAKAKRAKARKAAKKSA